MYVCTSVCQYATLQDIDWRTTPRWERAFQVACLITSSLTLRKLSTVQVSLLLHAGGVVQRSRDTCRSLTLTVTLTLKMMTLTLSQCGGSGIRRWPGWCFHDTVIASVAAAPWWIVPRTTPPITAQAPTAGGADLPELWICIVLRGGGGGGGGCRSSCRSCSCCCRCRLLLLGL